MEQTAISQITAPQAGVRRVVDADHASAAGRPEFLDPREARAGALARGVEGLEPLMRWVEKINERPLTQAGLKIPIDRSKMMSGTTDSEGAKRMVESAQKIVQH